MKMRSANSEVRTTTDPGFARRLNEALKLRSAHKYDEAKEILLALAEEYEDSAPVFGILGDVYWRLGLLNEAIPCFVRASELSPQSELASLGLFHCLWESGQTDLALDEMERFLSASHSAEYAKLLRDLIPVPPPARKPQSARRVASKKGVVKKSGT
jgi:tetratricopeptide (TPR) repeat protein